MIRVARPEGVEGAVGGDRLDRDARREVVDDRAAHAAHVDDRRISEGTAALRVEDRVVGRITAAAEIGAQDILRVDTRSEESRVGNECVSKCRYRLCTYH